MKLICHFCQKVFTPEEWNRKKSLKITFSNQTIGAANICRDHESWDNDALTAGIQKAWADEMHHANTSEANKNKYWDSYLELKVVRAE